MNGVQFIVGMLFAVILAAIFPNLGSSQSVLPVSWITSLGVGCIFFFYGLKLNLEELKSSLLNGKLHLFVQAITFLLFPLLLLIVYPLIPAEYQDNIWLGFFFLAALPSTVSSSVVMVSIAKGNVPAAIFNASLSGILGIIFTPLWMSLFVKNEIGMDFSSIYLRLFLEIILPLVLGLILNKWGQKWAQQNKKKLTLFDQTIILWIVFTSFSDAFNEKIFDNFSINWILLHVVGVILLFYGVYYISRFISKKMKLNREDTITAVYCGTKKSLTHGSVFGHALFSNPVMLVHMLLPIMLYHAFQIFVMSIIANKENEKSQEIRNS